jgi:hypothetical protein
MAKKRFNVLSPDGFPIHYENTYTSKKEALTAAKEWAEGYKRQGYYSSVRYGRIDLMDILDYCQLVEA